MSSKSEETVVTNTTNCEPSINDNTAEQTPDSKGEQPPEDTSASDNTQEGKGNIRFYRGKQYDITDPRFKGLSKNAIKRLLKDDLWEELRPERTKEKREKHKRKRRERRQLEDEGAVEPLPKKPRAKDMTVGNIGAVLDCSFSSYMIDKEVSSLRQQIVRTYGANVRAQKESLKLTITSFDDVLKKHMDAKAPAWQNWKNITITSDTYLDKFKKEELVYLTADSDNVIHELEEGKTYIIGGIVDKNRYKNLCKDKADNEGIATAQLPIGEYLQMSTRKVLTVNQVFEIMVKWADYRDWEKAFLEVIPGRKLKDTVILNQEDDNERQDDVIGEETSQNAVVDQQFSSSSDQ